MRPLIRGPLVLMTASGFAALGYQIVWTQQSALWLGHEAAAVLAVVAAFFGGIAAGSLVLGERIDRSSRPARWYAACEAVIGGWSLVLAFLMAPISRWLLDMIGPQPSPLWHWSIAFCGTFLLLLPATAAMGATLPAMERILATMRRQGSPIAALYAGNTFGAVLGVLGASFVLVPTFGLTRTAVACAVANIACAIAALRIFPQQPAAASPTAPTGLTVAAVGWAEPSKPARATSGMPVRQATRASSRPFIHEYNFPAAGRINNAATGMLGFEDSAQPTAPHSPSGQCAIAALAATGFLGIGYEVLVVRVLSQVAENTVYTFAILLAVYLIGTTLGAAAYSRWFANAPAADRLRDRLLQLLATACLIGVLSLACAETIKESLSRVFGHSMTAALAVETSLAAAAFLAPTVMMGALFSHLSTSARAAGVSFGRALGVNTLGAAVAPPLFGVLLSPSLGPKFALLLVVAGYLLLSSRRAWFAPAHLGTAGATLALAIWAPSLALVAIPEGGRLLSYQEGALATVSVVESSSGVRSLHINNRQQEGSNITVLADARQALLPILLHPAPRHALLLGLGTSVTARAASEDPLLQVDAVELLPEVIAASAQFADAFGDDDNPRLRVLAADARRFARAAHDRYDVIVADNFHPARSGSGALYTIEHFAAVQDRLAAGGLFCQWLPLHQLDLDTLRSIVRSFLSVYPNGWAMLATNSLDTPVLGLIAHRDAERFDLTHVRERLAAAQMAHSPTEFGIADDLALLGSFIAGPRSLAHFAGAAPLNTDDRPVVIYSAPRITYAPDSLPRDRLIALLHALAIEPDELLDGNQEADWNRRLQAYWTARNRYIEVGRNVHPTADVQRMLAQVRGPLLSVLHISPDFRPAYDPLLQMAAGLADTDATAARELLSELAQLQPSRPEAAEALRNLSSR